MIASIEELRRMTKKDLAKAYDISDNNARFLYHALKPEYFPIITDCKMSLEDMAYWTGMDIGTVGSYRSALITAGLEPSRSSRQKISQADRVLSFVSGNPSTYEEIAEKLGNTRERVGNVVDLLAKGHKVRKVFMSLGRHGSAHTFNSDKLVGKLSKRSIAYMPGDEVLLGKKVAECIPKNLTPGMKKSLTNRLRHKLPRESFAIVHAYMHEDA